MTTSSPLMPTLGAYCAIVGSNVSTGTAVWAKCDLTSSVCQTRGARVIVIVTAFVIGTIVAFRS